MGKWVSSSIGQAFLLKREDSLYLLPIFPTIPFLLTGVVDVDKVGSDAGPGSGCTTNNGSTSSTGTTSSASAASAVVAAGGCVKETKLGEYFYICANLCSHSLELFEQEPNLCSLNPFVCCVLLIGSLLRMGDELGNPIIY